MKIIIKNTYNGDIKKFDNKSDLIWNIESYKQNLGISINKRDTIGDLIYKFYGDYRRVYNEK